MPSNRDATSSLLSEDSIMLSQPPPLAGTLSYDSPDPSHASFTSSTKYEPYHGSNHFENKSGSYTYMQHVRGPSETSFTKQPLKGTAYLWKHWWLEATACLLFLAALLALFATLYIYDTRPSPDWPSWMSLNTIVAIYIVVLKSGILLVTAEGLGQLKWSWFTAARPLPDLVKYDDATRGPYGAGILLWRLRAKHLVASLGALIVVLALAADPFAQQIVHYRNCHVTNTTAVASIPRTNYYQNPSLDPPLSLYQAYESAILAGIFAPGELLPIPCATGNCTWPAEYSTVAVCSRCRDISDTVTIKNESITYTSSNKTYHSFLYKTAIPAPGEFRSFFGPLTATWPPYGEHADYAAIRGVGPSIQEAGASAVITPGATEIDFLLAKNINGPVKPVSLGKPWPECNITTNQNLWPCKGYGASRCKVSGCVKTFRASIENGVFQEHLVDVADEWGLIEDGEELAMLDTKCLSEKERLALTQNGVLNATYSRWLPWNDATSNSLGNLVAASPLGRNATMTERLLARGCLYILDSTTMDGSMQYLANYVTGTVRGLWNGVDPQDPILGPIVVTTLFNVGNVTFDRVDQMMANISMSLSNYVRGIGLRGFSKPALGQVNIEKTCIVVEWVWLSYPTALVLLTIVFFILLIWETRPGGQRPHIWKSSPLALLYHGLHESNKRTDPMSEEMNRIDAMNRTAKSTTVKLDDVDGNLKYLEIQHKERILEI